VTFDERSCAEVAKDATHNRMTDGRPLKVGWGKGFESTWGGAGFFFFFLVGTGGTWVFFGVERGLRSLLGVALGITDSVFFFWLGFSERGWDQFFFFWFRHCGSGIWALTRISKEIICTYVL
jgi:hypothetical protein